METDMVAPNVQEVVHGVLIVVTLIKDKNEASIVVGYKGKSGQPRRVPIDQYLKTGASDQEALNKVLEIVKGTVESAASAGLL
jgi:hypothetical protein